MKFLSRLFASQIFGATLLSMVACSGSSELPESWLKEWNDPSPLYRPLQLVHGEDLRAPEAQTERKGWDPLLFYRDSCGLGGVVCNVSSRADYLTSESEWKIFTEGVRYMAGNGMRIWIYDEEGYPSLPAGGLVLKAHPELEALELVYDKGQSNPYVVRPSFEFTHASNNYYASRRYPNPLDKKATEAFLGITHEAYLKHLGPELFGQIEAFFTDEPSLMAVNPGPIPDEVRANLRIQDPIDPNKKMLPMVSWVEGFSEKYLNRYQQELNKASLFSGETESDKDTRQKFWALIAEMNRSGFYDQIRDWCAEKRQENGGAGPLSSGHTLREEDLFHHVPFDGNKLLALSGMDLPGLDMLDSDPKTWMGRSWLAALSPVSTAALNGQRRVMCEISDFEQSVFGDKPVGLKEMQGACAWQMAYGVTDFTLYYGVRMGEKFPWRNPDTHKAYCDFIGRINALVMEAEPQRDVLLYYPIYDMQREYIPTATPADTATQSQLLRHIDASFNTLGNQLLQAQIPFVLADYLFLERAEVTDQGKLKIGGATYSSLIFPEGIVLPESLKSHVAEWTAKGLHVIYMDPGQRPSAQDLIGWIQPLEKLTPERNSIAFGKFNRSERDVYLLANSTAEPYQGELSVSRSGNWHILNPHTGEITSGSTQGDKRLPIHLEGNQTLLLVSPK